MKKLLESADGEVFDSCNFRREFDKAVTTFVEKTGKERFQLRDLRRTAAWKVWDKTKDVLLVRDFLGHKDVKTTQIYLGLSTQDI